MQSRYRGEIKLDIAHSMQGVVPYGGVNLPVVVKIANPTWLAKRVVDEIDQVLDQLAFIDDLASRQSSRRFRGQVRRRPSSIAPGKVAIRSGKHRLRPSQPLCDPHTSRFNLMVGSNSQNELC